MGGDCQCFFAVEICYLIYMDTETLLKNTSRSLYLSVQALPKNMRPAFGIAYLLCRYADTIADTPLIAPARRLDWIGQFPALLEEQNQTQISRLTQEIEGGSENPYEAELIRRLAPCLQALNRIRPHQRACIMEVVRAVCEGMKTDLRTFPPENAGEIKAFACAEDLMHYCRLMGGKPGLFWSKLIYQLTPVPMPEQDFYELGQHIGDALQIVNILRDLPKDLRIGRCYFPQEELSAQGLTPYDLLDAKNSARFEPVKRKWIAWGVQRLKSGLAYFEQLPKMQLGQRAAVAWPILWSADTLFKVYQTPDLLNPKKRVKISRATIYATMALTPLMLLSNRLFSYGLKHKLQKFH